jgi:hypothetical protein
MTMTSCCSFFVDTLFVRLKKSTPNLFKHVFLNYELSRALVAHIYNPSYSGGREQEDFGSKPAQVPWQIVHETYLEKHPSQKRAGRVAQGESPEFKTQYHKKL